MTAKAALAKALLEGQVLNIRNCFDHIGLTNIGREIPRMIEMPFGVEVSRTPRKGTSRYGSSVNWVDYRLNRTEYNKEGILKMKEYVLKEMGVAKTEKQVKEYKQTSLFYDTV